MSKCYILLFCLFLISCSTYIQYVGSIHPSSTTIDVYVTDTSITKPYTVIGRGYIQDGLRGVNWNQVRKQSKITGKKYGADAVLIIQRSSVSPFPAIRIRTTADSVGNILQTNSNTHTYFPVSSWHDIVFVKYNQ